MTEIDKFVIVEVWVDTPHQREEARWVATLIDEEPRLQGMVPSLAPEKGLSAENELARISEINPWRDPLQALARPPNVSCKISGVPTEAD